MNKTFGLFDFADLRMCLEFLSNVSFRRELWVNRSINATRNPGVVSTRIVIDVYTF